MAILELCARCAREIRTERDLELCWLDLAPLCQDCWEFPGVCARPECDRAQADLVRATTEQQRAAIMCQPFLARREN